MPRRRPLMLVDGYNVIHATPRYEELVDAQTNPKALDTDPFVRAREALLADVAAYAKGAYEAVIVYDAADNLAPERPVYKSAGILQLFSETDQSADEVIEGLVTEARHAGRSVTLVTSDGTIRSTAGFGPGEVTCISSDLLVREMARDRVEAASVRAQAARTHLTLEDRIAPEQREKLWQLLRG